MKLGVCLSLQAARHHTHPPIPKFVSVLESALNFRYNSSGMTSAAGWSMHLIVSFVRVWRWGFPFKSLSNLNHFNLFLAGILGKHPVWPGYGDGVLRKKMDQTLSTRIATMLVGRLIAPCQFTISRRSSIVTSSQLGTSILCHCPPS